MTATKLLPMYPVNDDSAPAVSEYIPGGFYLKARCIQNSAIAIAPPHVREIWDWILKEANHKPMNTYGKTIGRGQLLTDYKEIQEGLHWKEGYIKKSYKKHHVDYAMRWLRQERMITTQKTTRGLVITVCKYERYQNPANYENANGYDNQKTIKRQPADRINKNDKKEKKDSGAAPAKSYKEWTREEFIADIEKYKDQYDRTMLNEFFKHWSEKDAKGKMLFQKRETWETNLRLARWHNNEDKFTKK